MADGTLVKCSVTRAPELDRDGDRYWTAEVCRPLLPEECPVGVYIAKLPARTFVHVIG